MVYKNNEETPWLSVIIPIYNAEKYIDKCIKSILMQSFKSFELILVNDGSTDNTSAICKSYTHADKRVKYYEKENGGSFQSRLFGVEHASGMYITFCDSDDYYPNKRVFSTIYQTLNGNDLCAMQFGYKRVFNHLTLTARDARQPLFINRESFIKNEYPIFLCSFYENSHLTMNVWNKVYKRAMLAKLPSSENADRIFWGDDLVFNLYALKNCMSMVVIPDILYVYRENAGGTAKFSENAMQDLNQIKKYQLQFLEQIEHPDKPKILSTLHTETACWFGDWIRDALEIIDEEKVSKMILEVLEYPEIKSAREYFNNENDLNWEAMELLRKADPQKYIKWAKMRQHTKKSIKSSIKQLYRKI